ncbi:MAG: Arylmalonate decarboxylase [Gammaproteobacteria bacterium]|nr:Arylmalonate decarboxylase [Gammaproteobacteria bacterium]
MKRLGILYPPCGAESEYYYYGEGLSAEVRIALIGVRIFGDSDEHAPEYLNRTAEIDNLALSARAMKKLQPDAVVWACTSGSFIGGLEHARGQITALSSILGCPATSTSLAFVAALEHLAIDNVSVLASYPERTASKFISFLAQCGIDTCNYECLAINSGPVAANLDQGSVSSICRALAVPDEAALLIPDTAIPAMHWIAPLERELDRPVLTANQVSLWETARLANVIPEHPIPGRLCVT